MTITNDGIKECSLSEIQENNTSCTESGDLENILDVSNIAVCRKIRQLARINDIIVRTDAYSNQNARNLLEYLDFCGIPKEEYISDYLRNLQPYMIERKPEEEYDKNVVCILDKLYNISLYIKVEKPLNNEHEYTVVSFHEDYQYKNGIPVAKQNSVLRKKDLESNKQIYVPVFKDDYRSIDLTNQTAFINVYVQRGLLTIKLSLPTKLKFGDVYFVRKADIERSLLDYCNTYIEDLYASDLDLDFSQIDVFTMLQQVSFTSYGKDSFSSLSLLIDSLFRQNDRYSKSAADFAIVTFAKNLKLNDNDKQALIHLLAEKFRVTNHKGICLLIERITQYLEEDNPNRNIVKLANPYKPTGNGEGGDDGDADGTSSFGSSSDGSNKSPSGSGDDAAGSDDWTGLDEP